ncbi:MAG: YggS family pyridoxal phosphate enzyme [Hydrogenophilales bacterium 28-61-23]|nr:MAG: YggS family pyridoxal phosphate enzyme [Hydrogenophilales bacterium 28-61-23]
MGAIAAALQACQNRIASACQEAGRPANCARLIAVGKTFPAAALREAHAAGQRVFGESYLQEALPKLEQLADLPLEWHFIGPVQSNKTRQIAARFDWVHGIEREKIAQRLSEQRPANLPPLNVCIQVNVSAEASKSGVAPEAALELAGAIAVLPNLRLRGFMTIPEPTQDIELQHRRFRQAAELLQTARTTLGVSAIDLDTLSMGMSADLEAAIHEGATLVRVGTAIFGARPTMENNTLEQAR